MLYPENTYYPVNPRSISIGLLVTQDLNLELLGCRSDWWQWPYTC